jgi:hypothetical protein
METYTIKVNIRKKGGLIPTDARGLKVPSIQFKEQLDPNSLERSLTRIFLDFQAITPEGSFIDVEAYLPNSISNTYMCMASLYGGEEVNRFVKH